MRLDAGDIVLLPFPHTSVSGGKQRPALALTSPADNADSPDVIVAYVTSQHGAVQVLPQPFAVLRAAAPARGRAGANPDTLLQFVAGAAVRRVPGIALGQRGQVGLALTSRLRVNVRQSTHHATRLEVAGLVGAHREGSRSLARDARSDSARDANHL
ncbi:MAG: type II toxin-antitoxin system PemK/MazF family toxin [Thermoplasmatota archaeon]